MRRKLLWGGLVGVLLLAVWVWLIIWAEDRNMRLWSDQEARRAARGWEG
jgi:hypothetical protein